jgi:hypothetical protein
MAYNEAQKKATMKYIKDKRDIVRVSVPKGERERWKKHAEEVRGVSMSALIVELMEKDIKER